MKTANGSGNVSTDGLLMNPALVLLSFREKAEAIRERYEDTQANTQEILEQLEQLLQTVLKQEEDQ